MLGKEIGKGAYAVVRYAIHKASNRKVAIKIYDKTKFQDSSRLRNAHREIQILNKLNHSNILKMYEAIETDEFLYLILELINGLSLNDYVKKHSERRLPESDACRIFYQIILALEYCHANDVSHRDIKFDNVLLDHCNNVKIIDFGFSTWMPKDQRTKTFCGTPSYMAPEIILKSEYLGPPVDIWACGVVLFGMLCGYFPFKSHSDKECYKKILSGLVYIPSFVSSEPKELIEKILVHDPEQRLTAKEILTNPWFKKLGNLNLNSEVSHYTTNPETEFTQGDSAISHLVKII
jgi:MAP/microtubule affinity-regulating kinase